MSTTVFNLFHGSLFFIILSLFVSCGNPPIQAEALKKIEISEEEKEQLRYLKEVEWPKAYREQDTVLLNRLLGEDFKMIDASGNWFSKRDELDWIKKNGVKNDSFFYEIKRFEIKENGTAVICGTGHIFNDTTETIYQSSNILIKRDTLWKAILSHVSGIKEVK